jgi:hypothetical protein
MIRIFSISLIVISLLLLPASLSMAQDVPPQKSEVQQEPDDQVEPSPSDINKPRRQPVIRRVVRLGDRDEMLKRARELRLAGVKPMWGDFFGGLPINALVTSDTTPPPLWPDTALDGEIYQFAPGGGVSYRRIKLAEGNSALPTDRFIANYSYFNDVLDIGDVNRYTLGFERTFDDGMRSIELRMPIASTLAADQVIGVPTQFDTQVGNLSLAYKAIIAIQGSTLTSAGLGISIPTAPDSRLLNEFGDELIRVDNQAVHLLPFISWIGTAGDRLTWQAFVQFDVDSNGNPLVIAGPTGPTPAGRLSDVTLLFADLGMSYRWLEDREGMIRTVTPFAEIHYSGTFENIPSLEFGQPGDFQLNLAPQGVRYDVVNLTLGAHLQMGDNLFVRPGIVIPLREDDIDRQFDYEVGVQVSVLH